MNERPGATLFATPARAADEPTSPEGEVIEVPLLLPGWQVAALEAAARREGLTFAAAARRLIRDFLRRPRP
jgi:hypothetical protein